MLWRFAAYGFLKNQRYFEPFLLLFFMDLGFSFTQIGIIIGLRELLINCFEIPSGALADVYGRRRCMAVSFIAYIAAFMTLALADQFWLCLLAMLPFAVGDAFRTGTHKAIIFSWLRNQEREDDRQEVYGYTRSWSKIGSAVSIPIACGVVLLTQDYRLLFWASLVPYAIDLVNVSTYPRSVDAERDPSASIRSIIRQTVRVFKQCIVFKPLRRLLIESMSFEGTFKANKDYIQVMVMAVAVSLPAFLETEEQQRTAIIAGLVYMCLHLLGAVASRLSHRMTEQAGGEHLAARQLWYANAAVYLGVSLGLYFEYSTLALCLFTAVHVLQNIWRPLMVTRIDSAGGENDDRATLLSVESQSRSFACMLLAPLLGLAVDYCQAHEIGGDYWPVAVVGLLASLWILFWYRT